MNISTRCEYAARALVELACHENDEAPIPAARIAAQRDIPDKFLVHILLQLKRAGLVRSVRGNQGGYLLARNAAQITMLDIVQAIDGPVLQPLPGEDLDGPGLDGAWREIATNISSLLASWTLRGIIDRTAGSGMYYI